MSDARIIKAVLLRPEHRVTGETFHERDGVPVGRPSRLIIVEFGDGYNLIHLDEEGAELTDTFHESVDDALQQAAFEFTIDPNEWSDSSAPYDP